jgi:hypothetical protein
MSRMNFEPNQESAADVARTGGVSSGRAPRKPHRVTPRRYLPPKIDARSRVGKRVKELRALFEEALAAQGRPLTALLALKVQTAAEAMATSEDARQRFLRGEISIRAEALATIERRADALVSALRLSDGPEPPTSTKPRQKADQPTPRLSVPEYLAMRDARRAAGG